MAKKSTYRDWSKKILGWGREKSDSGDQPTDQQQPIESGEVYVANRILVIDDSEIDRMIIEEILVQAGYEVTLASDGEEGIKLFRDFVPGFSHVERFALQHASVVFLEGELPGGFPPDFEKPVSYPHVRGIEIPRASYRFKIRHVIRIPKEQLPKSTKAVGSINPFWSQNRY